MEIGIIGSGTVAQTLGAGLVRHEHRVTLGTSNPEKLRTFQQANPGIRVDSFNGAAGAKDLVILAVKGTVAVAAARSIDPQLLAGKVVIDANNPIADGAPVNGVVPFFTGPGESLMEQLQRAVPKARWVKAFSCVGNAFFIDPQFPGGPPTMFICGNDQAAKTHVTSLLAGLGWDVADMGAVEAARAIEPLCMLWLIPGFLRHEWAHAFRLLRQNG